MVPAPPPLPIRFPCWCRAVYSWGGESKRDLGFMEGDLIECLNAGDGSWWTGKLWRDRRTVGIFPSNFVEVLPDHFKPTTRSVSPLPDTNTPSPKPMPQKSKAFRKPFEAYAKAPHYTTAKQPETYKPGSQLSKTREGSGGSSRTSAPPSRARSPMPSQQQLDYGSRAPSPAPPRHDSWSSRHPSPAPQHSMSYGGRSPSPAPPHSSYMSYGSRAPSPAPPHAMEYDARGPSPAPPHHLGYGSRAHSPAPPPPMQYGSRMPSPAPPHPGHVSARAPSPARSPAPSFTYPGQPRAHSPAPSFDDRQYRAYRPPGSPMPEDSPPPPPPPPHRHVNVSRHDSNASYNNQLDRHGSNASFQHRSAVGMEEGARYDRQLDGRHTPRMPSPAPSPGGSHMTPSPLREAMDGVMEQLGALGMPGEGRDASNAYDAQTARDSGSPEPPLDPWSPESFDMVAHRARKKEAQRPQTSMGIASDEGYETWSGESSQDPSLQSGHREDIQQANQLSNYVERMENRLSAMQQQTENDPNDGQPPPPPPKGQLYERPKSSMDGPQAQAQDQAPVPVSAPAPERKVRTRKSAYDVGRTVLGRTFTTKTNSTSASSGNQSSTTQSSDRSLMSGASASAFSATSAGSLARKNQQRAQSALGVREVDVERPETPFTGVTYHSSHASNASRPKSQAGFNDDPGAGLGGLVQPKAPKRSLFKKLFDTAKTGVATGRSSIVTATDSPKSSSSPFARSIPPGSSPALSERKSMIGLGNSFAAKETARDFGPGNPVDWVQVRRDINRSNSLSKIERQERQERCQMLDHPALFPVDEFYESVDGDEGANGMPVAAPIDYQSINLSQVDKNSRFISSLPPMTTAITLATTYVCRPYRSDVQRLRAIFTWVAERICWEEEFEGPIDTRRVIQSKRGCAEEYAVLVTEMCAAVGVECEVVRGYLKTPGEIPDHGFMPRANHWWNAVLIDNEWRMMDCCMASPSNPRRHLYSGAGQTTADSWWFLTRPSELCWTHIPEHHEQQHLCPPQAHEVLLNLPCACSPWFRNGMEMVDYNSSMTRIEDLEMVHIKFNVPEDIEVAAEVEVRAYCRDQDGDVFESGDVVKKKALAQAEWFNGTKRYTVKALLPGDEGQGVMKVYAGKRGLMHSIKDIPHPMAFALPIVHAGENPPYDFVTRHPTPHAQRHDIYVVQPQCARLALNNTFVFAIRQHPSSCTPGAAGGVGGAGSAMTPSSNPGGASPIPFVRPGSAMSMNASSASGSNPSTASGSGASGRKPAKLAIQTPGGKILRLMRKEDRKGISAGGRTSRDEEASDGGTWETIIKCSEKGTWRGLVLADRTARWCVFAEWVCVG